MILPLMAEKTTAVSLLNGISSEDILAERIPRGRIPDCVAIGMDAVRVGTDMTFGNMGRWQLGVRSGLGREESAEQKERLEALTAFLDRAGIDYEICGDIRHSMWNKFMINIGINQTCMVYETTYGGAIAPGPVREELIAAMREVMPVAAAEGVMLTEEDLAQDLLLIGRLSADGCPSMRQDAMAGRKSEAELFAGTLIRLAEKHGIAVPVNERYYRIIREREESYR